MRLAIFSTYGLAEAHPEPAADDHRLDVEQVDRRGDPGAERLERLVDQLLGELVVVVERPLPDPAREPVAAALLHDLEQLRRARRPRARCAPGPPSRRGRRRPPCSRGARRGSACRRSLTTMWPISPAAPRPVQRLPSRISPPPTPVPQKTPSIESYGLPAPSLNSALVATSTSLPIRTCAPSASESVGPSGKLPSQPGQVAGLGDVAGLLVRVARRADADPGERVGLHAGGFGRLDQRLGHLGGDVRGPALGRRRAARLAADLAGRADDRRLDLRPAEVDAPAQGVVASSRPASARVYSSEPVEVGEVVGLRDAVDADLRGAADQAADPGRRTRRCSARRSASPKRRRRLPLLDRHELVRGIDRRRWAAAFLKRYEPEVELSFPPRPMQRLLIALFAR